MLRTTRLGIVGSIIAAASALIVPAVASAAASSAPAASPVTPGHMNAVGDTITEPPTPIPSTPPSPTPTVTPPSTATNFAGYGAGSIASSIGGFVKVPTLSCAENAPGHYVGQSAGVQLINGLHAVASLRTYCRGQTAVYATEFSLPRNGNQVYGPAKLGVRPGDLLFLAVRTTSNGITAEIIDSTQHHKAAYFKGDALPDANPYAETTTISTNSSGGPLVFGQAPSGNPVMDAPIASGALRFSGVQVDGQPLASVPQLFLVNWVDSSSNVLVKTGQINGGSNFRLTFTQ